MKNNLYEILGVKIKFIWRKIFVFIFYYYRNGYTMILNKIIIEVNKVTSILESHLLIFWMWFLFIYFFFLIMRIIKLIDTYKIICDFSSSFLSDYIIFIYKL